MKDANRRLTNNIRNRGKMESVPYCVLVDGKVEIVSGHHRIRAAREAGITEAPILVDESGLIREEIVAKQLAHNRLSGFDDEATLKQLFESLNDPSLILESGLADDLMVLPHVDLAVGITPELDMDWKVITLTFLPHQLENFNALIDMMPSSDLVGLAPLSDYQRFVDALIKWARYKNVRNVGTALALLADIALVELAEAAEAEEKDAKSRGIDSMVRPRRHSRRSVSIVICLPLIAVSWRLWPNNGKMAVKHRCEIGRPGPLFTTGANEVWPVIPTLHPGDAFVAPTLWNGLRTT